ncbi:MAG: 2-oxo-4-hydroxy-4-carboxy-5-ureidoimidazoline decarboxylase [Nannocystaceae bacterium]
MEKRAGAGSPLRLARARRRSRAALQRCCGAARWVDGMLARSVRRRRRGARRSRRGLAQASAADARGGWHHPAIGEDLARLRERFASTSGWASSEQAGVGGADETTLAALRDGNVAYRERFGYTFVVCATGKSAAQMLALLRQRLDNPPDRELAIAAAEQAQITRLRLAKLTAPP